MKRILESIDRRLISKSEVPLRQRFGSYLYERHHHMIALFASLCLGTFGWALSTDTYGQQSIVPLFVGLVAGGTLYAILRLYFRVTDHFNKEGN